MKSLQENIDMYMTIADFIESTETGNFEDSNVDLVGGILIKSYGYYTTIDKGMNMSFSVMSTLSYMYENTKEIEFIWSTIESTINKDKQKLLRHCVARFNNCKNCDDLIEKLEAVRKLEKITG